MTFIYEILDSKILSVIVATILIVAGLLFKITNNDIILGTIVPLSLISIAFSFIYVSLVIEKATLRDIIRILIAPLAIFATVIFFKNVNVQSNLLRAGLFFIVNILFFNKEIRQVTN